MSYCYGIFIFAALVLFAISGSAADNLLVNPEFKYYEPGEGEPALYVAGWNVAQRGDAEAEKKCAAFPDDGKGNVVKILPGKKFWQFAALSDLGVTEKDTLLSLSCQVAQDAPKAVAMRLCLMGVESGEGTWEPKTFGLKDERTFSCHGRGELIRLDTIETISGEENATLNAEGLKVDWNFKYQKEADPSFKNAVGILAEFENLSDKPVYIKAPILSKGEKAAAEYQASRPLPEYYRMLPRTMKKLLTGDPVYILTLGSSIDRGSANPPLYPYGENPASPDYKKPLCDCRYDKFDPALVGRPELKGYYAWGQHYFMYTGRMRMELMRKFNYPVDKILLNVMACDGSSIGESHSGFADYASFALAPYDNNNGHSAGKKWEEYYPALFADGNKPAPDLVVFGHGHNEHIDAPDEIAAYEGAVRWFQRHYPAVEFVSCMWIRDKGKPNSMTEPMEKFCAYYNIPFIDAGEMINQLKQTANFYALATDGGHPQAGAHYLWFKQLEKAFEVTSPAAEPIPQKILPERMNSYSYNWEGEIVSFTAESKRIVNKRMMVIEDSTLNLWAKHDLPCKDKTEYMKLRIDGVEAKDCGHGKNSPNRDLRNSAFVHGRLSIGDRHLVEIVGTNPEITFADNKVCLNKHFIPAGDPAWKDAPAAGEFTSAWGAPYGDKACVLKEGESMSVNVTGNLIAVAYVDVENGGAFRVEVDGENKLEQKADAPYVDSEGGKYYLENRKAVGGLPFGEHAVKLTCASGEVKILGLYCYDAR